MSKVRSMNRKAKIGLVLVFALAFSAFMCGGWYGPQLVHADAQTRYPSADSLVQWDTSTGTAGIHWEDVSETSYDTTTYVQTATANDNDVYSFAAFTVPTGATITDVTITLAVCDVTAGNNRINAELRVGGTDYLHATTTTNPGSTCDTYSIYSFSWTQNPKSTAVWTVDDVNGAGANALQGFGINTTDASPNVRVTQVYATVNYTANAAPTLSISQPDGAGDTVTVGQTYDVTYSLADSDDVATAAFYYDTDNAGLDGTGLTGECATALEGSGVTCIWDTTGMTPGNYYVYGITNDGVNPQVSAYSPGMITINAGAVNTTTAGTATATPKDKAINVSAPYSDDSNGNNTLQIEWGLNGVDYSLGNVIRPHSASPYAYSISGLTNGTSYQVRVTYHDADGATGSAVQTFSALVPINPLLHNSRNMSSTKWTGDGGWGIAGGKYGEFVCETCHVRGSTNIKRVRASVTTPDTSKGTLPGDGENIVFNRTSGTSGVDFGVMGDDSDSASRTDPNADNRICEVCHTYDSGGANGVTVHAHHSGGADLGNHMGANATDCIDCHKHSSGFSGAGGTCDGCHGATPSVFWSVDKNANGNAPGAHAAHFGDNTWYTTAYDDTNLSTGAYYKFNCKKCHGNHGSPAPEITLSSTNVPPSQGGSYASNTCSSVYCHGNFTGGLNASPTWTGTATCGTCHANDAASATSLNNSHTRHASSAAGGLSVACSDCHGSRASQDGHVDGKVQWSLNTGSSRFGTNAKYNGAASGTINNIAPSASYQTCTNLYCHSNVQSGTGAAGATSYGSPTWGAASVSCSQGATGCHGNAPSTPAANDAHGMHTSGNYSFTCASCHNNGGDESANHANGTLNMTINAIYGGTYSQGDHTPGAGGYGYCSSVYCHGNFTGGLSASPVWDGTAACGSCHNYTNATPPTNVNHPRHAGQASGQLNLACTACHPSRSAADGHVDLSVQWDLDRADPKIGSGATYSGTETGSTGAKAPSGTYGNCGNVYCHSSVQSGDGTGVPLSYDIPTWGVSSVTCDSCHGQGNHSSGQPSTGAHEKHVTTNSYACSVCHSGHGKDTGTHANRLVNITFDGTTSGASASYSLGATKTPQSAAFGTCSTTYCHGIAASPAWNGSTTCSSCHSSMGAGTGVSGYISRHQRHTDSATYKLACENCHDSTQTQHGKGLADAASPQRAAEIQYENTGTAGTWLMIQYGGGGTTFNYTRINQSPYGLAAPTPAYGKGAAGTADNGFPWTGGTCSNIWCHSNANPWNGTNSYASPQWNGLTTSCTVCHQGASAGTTLSAKHERHLVTYSFTCDYCHANTAAGNAALSAFPNLHVDGAKNVNFSTWVNSSATYDLVNHQCANTYCHSNGTTTSTGGSPAHAVFTWNATPTCASCHGNPPLYSSGSPKANSHAAHSSYTCDKCHYATTTTGNTITTPPNHVNKVYNIAAGNGVTITSYAPVTPPNTGGGTCNGISCHGGNNATWGGPSLKCSDCHSGASDTNNYVYNDGNTAKINSTEWGYSGHGKTAGTYDSTGNTAANLPGAAGTGDPCLYCHDGTVGHGDSTNVFRLRNFSHATYGKNGACLICHATGSTGITGVAGIGDKNAASKVDKYHYGTQHSATLNGGQFCWDCHDPHGDRTSGSGPIAMIHLNPAQASDATTGAPTTATGTAVVFTARTAGSSYANSSTGNGVCNVCHTRKAADPNKMVHWYNASPYTDDSHNSSQLCTTCHLHSGDATYDGKAFSANEDDCKSCHATSIRPVQAEFERNSHHINKTWASITNFDCVVCHAEGQIVSGQIKGNPTYHHAPAGTVDLYDADNRGTIYSIALTSNAISKNNTDNTTLDTFCMSCHDSDTSRGAGKGGAAAVTTANGFPSGYSATNPFNEATPRQNAYDLVTKEFNTGNRPLDAYGAFDTTASSNNHHAVRGARYTTATLTMPYQSLRQSSLLSAAVALYSSGTGISDNSTMHCNDCHSTGYSAHGSANEYLLQTSTQENPTAEHTNNYVCLKCHINGGYSDGSHTASSSNYIDSASATGTARTSGNGHITGISCLNCHDGAMGFGGVHGFPNATYTDGAGNTGVNKRRFLPGSALKFYEPGTDNTPWVSRANYAVGSFVTPTTPNGHYYAATAAGRAASTEPAWPTNGTSITDGTVTWKDMGTVAEVRWVKKGNADNTCYTLSTASTESSCTQHGGGRAHDFRNVSRPVNY